MKKGSHLSEEARERRRGRRLSEEHRKNIGLGLRGRPCSEETRNKIRLAITGQHRSEEFKRKNSLAKKGFRHSEEAKRKISLAGIGRKPSMKTREKIRASKMGRKRPPLSEEWKKKISLANRGRKWSRPFSEEHRKKISLNSRAQWSHMSPEEKDTFIKKQRLGMAIYPNKQEQKMQSILDGLFPDEYKFVGDGQIVIAGKFPDFINVNGKKKIVEVYGDYWHRGDDPQDRINTFKPYGYDTLVIWERELRDENKLREKLKIFHEGVLQDEVNC